MQYIGIMCIYVVCKSLFKLQKDLAILAIIQHASAFDFSLLKSTTDSLFSIYYN